MATVTVTIGAAGDYATYAALVADATSAFSASDDAIIQLIDATDYAEQFDLSSLSSAVAVASIHLTSSGSGRHDGTPGSGARIRPGGAGGNSTGVVSIPNNCSVRVSWLEITTSGTWNNLVYSTDDSTFTHDYEVDHCIVHTNGSPSSGNVRGIIISRGNVSAAHNNIVYNLQCSASGGAGITGILTGSGSSPDYYVYNNTVDDLENTGGTGGVVGIQWDADSGVAIRNNVAGEMSGTSSGVKLCFVDSGAGTETHNASVDATAFDTSVQTSIAVGAQWVDRSTRDYRIQDTDADIWETGVSLSAVALNELDTDIGGNARSGTWSIGASSVTTTPVDGITLTSPVSKVVWQRTSGTANVTVAGDYTGTPTSIEYRWDGGSWTTLVASPSSGSFSEVVSLPEGQGTLEVRFSNATSVTDSVTEVSIGDLFWIAGQSNASGRLTSTQTYTHGSLQSFHLSSGTWTDLADPLHADQGGNGSCWPLVATLIAANQSVPVAFFPTAEGGTNSGQWTPGSGAKYTAGLATVTGQSPNGLAALLWDQGEADANSDPATSQASYNTFLDTLAADAQTDTSLTFPTLVTLTGWSNTTSPAGSSLDNVRAAQIEAWGDNADIEPGPNSINRDSLHWESDTEGATQAALWWLAIEDALYGGSNGRGPRPSTISSVSGTSTATIVFDRDLDTDDTTYAAAAFSVDNDDGTARSVTAAARTGARTVELTLDGALDGTSPTLSFGTINTAGGVTIPQSAAISLPATINSLSAVSIPAEPIYASSVSVTAPDLTPPTISAASINTAGDTLTVAFLESGSPPILPATGITGFSLTAAGQSLTLAAGVRQTDTSATFSITGTVYTGQTVTIDYASGNVTDSASSPNSLADVSDVAVTNNSTQTPSITVTSPVSSDRRLVGTAEAIAWTSAGVTGTVDILVSTNNGGAFSVVAAAETNDGTYNWNPDTVATQAIVRIRSTDNNSITDDSDAFIVATTAEGVPTDSPEWDLLRQVATDAGLELTQ